MQRDKAMLTYAGQAAWERAWERLDACCTHTFVSLRPEQAREPVYGSVARFTDGDLAAGPAAGLLSAWAQRPHAAWLLLAVDMPLVDATVLTALIGARDPAALATGFRNSAGVPEPLCTIWEPAARAVLTDRALAGRYSLREVLETPECRIVDPAEPRRLLSVDTPEDYAALQASLTA